MNSKNSAIYLLVIFERFVVIKLIQLFSLLLLQQQTSELVNIYSRQYSLYYDFSEKVGCVCIVFVWFTKNYNWWYTVVSVLLLSHQIILNFYLGIGGELVFRGVDFVLAWDTAVT